jgi:hypothetical protein
MGMRAVGVGVVGIGVLSAGAMGQGFPVRSVSGVYDGTHPAFAGLYSPSGQGLLQTWVVSAGADLDGDGARDLVAVFSGPFGFDPLMVVFPGTADGLGEPSLIGAFEDVRAEGERVYDAGVGDLNGDGLLDIAVLTDEGVVRVVLNQGAGSYVGGSDLALGSGNWTRFDLVDVDGDGAIDVLVWEDEGDIGYVTDVGSGGAFVSLGDSGNANIGVRAGDLDGDGLVDVVASGYGGGLRWARRGGGGFASFDEVVVDLSNFVHDGVASVLGDYDGDGVLDVVYTSTNTGLRSLGFVTGPIVSGETRGAVVVDVPVWNGLPVVPGQASRPVLESRDLDGDGSEDLVARDFRVTDPLGVNDRFGIIREYETLGEARLLDLNEGHNTARSYIDLGSDGVLDRAQVELVLSNVFDPLETFEDRVMVVATFADIGHPDRVPEGLDRIATTSDQRSLTLVDMDMDGDEEILLSLESNVRIVDREDSGVMSYNPATRFTVQASTPRGYRSVVSDLDSDPTPDVVSLARESGASFPAVYLNPESGVFGVTTLNDPVVYDGSALAARGLGFAAESSFAVGDIDGDGDGDIVIRGEADDSMGFVGDAVLAWLNNGEGVFSDGALTALPEDVESQFSSVPISIALGDFDGDGSDELMSLGRVDSSGLWSVAYFEGGSGGAFSLVREIPLMLDESRWRITVEDLDADGFEDVLISCYNTDPFYISLLVDVLYGSPSGLNGPSQMISGLNGVPSGVTVLDVDGDGMHDLVMELENPFLFGRTAQIGIARQISPRVFMPTVEVKTEGLIGLAVMDVDRDGTKDFVSASVENDELRVFFGVSDGCGADLNLDGALDFFDVSAFLGFYSEERPIADFTRDGVFDFFDLSAFLGAFSQGCP